jgi:UDP-3-O-[3-hydroxymyristoyl] N-acetylglucosamine deacetylase/3-hydroxyacyl-[acyl-carrier-protein] dehydratase
LVKQRAQRTIARETELSGIGLHSGAGVQLRLRPADANTGVVFRRVDLPGKPEVPATVEYLHTLPRRSSLRNGAAEVETVEHLLSSLHAFGVDNVVCELSGVEVPGMDGSSSLFAQALLEVGVREQKETVEPYVVTEPVHVNDGEWAIVALPREEGLRLSYTLGFEQPRSLHETLTFDLDRDAFVKSIAPARTFVTSDEIERLRAAGLGQGATPDNTLVISPDAAADATRLRFPDEYLRHKMLDLIGDLMLFGRPICAHVVAHRTGHAANRALVEKLSLEMHRQEDIGQIQRGSGFGITEIMRILPHRYPMLLVDRVVQVQGFRRAVGIKNVTVNEPFFSGHYPETPIMPAVLTLEALAQLAGILLLRKLEYAGKVAVFLGMDRVRLRHAVMPGDQLRLIVETVHLGKRGGKVKAHATVRDTVVAEAEMKFMLVDSPSNVEHEEL